MRRLTRKPWRRSIFSIDLWVGFLKLLGLSGSLSLWGLLGLSAALLWCPRALAADADDFDFTYDIPSMIQLNPDFSTYPGSDGVIWLKRIDYRIAPEGGIERKSLWILLGRKGLDPRWLLWNVPVPRSGHAEILEASAYSPGSGEKIMDALEIASTGDTMRVAAFSNLPDEFILVVSYRELFPEKLSVEDLVWVAEPLPVWETALRVTVPAGHPFYYGSNADAVPKASNVDDRMVYEWRVINTEAFRFSLRGDSRGYIAFGSREGREAAVRSVKELEAARLPEPPSVVGKVRESGKRAEARAVENVLKWIYEQPELLSDGPREIPAEAPWTLREKLLLAYGWLKAAGVDVRLFWQLAYRPAADEPACAAMAVAPVLGVPGIEKKEAFYYTMRHAPRMGESSVSLWGQTIYGLAPDGGLEERKVADSNASSNRLSAHFDLTVNEDGIMSGTLRIVKRNAWRHLLLPSASANKEPDSEALASLVKNLFSRTPRYRDLQFTDLGGEYEIRMTFAETQAIKSTGGQNLLVSLPPLIPSWFKSLSSGPFPYALRFPFILEARFDLTLPGLTANVMLPTPTERNMGKVKYAESYKLSKKKTLTAEVRMTVGTTAIAEDNAADLGAALQNWQVFMTRHLPVQLKVK